MSSGSEVCDFSCLTDERISDKMGDEEQGMGEAGKMGLTPEHTVIKTTDGQASEKRRAQKKGLPCRSEGERQTRTPAPEKKDQAAELAQDKEGAEEEAETCEISCVSESQNGNDNNGKPANKPPLNDEGSPDHSYVHLAHDSLGSDSEMEFQLVQVRKRVSQERHTQKSKLKTKVKGLDR